MHNDPRLSFQSYSTTISSLLKQTRPMPLGHGTPDEAITSVLRSLTIEEAFAPRKVVDRNSARLCFAGVWLLYDHLEECHRIAQEIETRDAAYWHAIMHRREGGFSNSKYWFKKVGEHEIFPSLCEEAKKLMAKSIKEKSTSFLIDQAQWNPSRFVDLCEASVTRRTNAEDLCRSIQQAEWRLFFDCCYRKAIGG